MPKKDSVIALGDLVRDTITDFKGVVIARTEWLNGCVRFTLQPQALDKEGKIHDALSFDVEQLELVKKNVFKPNTTDPAAVATGGPYPEPVRR